MNKKLRFKVGDVVDLKTIFFMYRLRATVTKINDVDAGYDYFLDGIRDDNGEQIIGFSADDEELDPVIMVEGFEI